MAEPPSIYTTPVFDGGRAALSAGALDAPDSALQGLMDSGGWTVGGEISAVSFFTAGELVDASSEIVGSAAGRGSQQVE